MKHRVDKMLGYHSVVSVGPVVRQLVVVVVALFLQGFGFNTSNWSPRTSNYASYRNVIMKDQPNMGYFRLGEASGTMAVDSSIAGNTGTYSGGCSLGQSGAIESNTNYAVAFNGSNCSIDLPNSYVSSSLSIEAWFKSTATAAGGIAVLMNPPAGSVSPSLTLKADGTIAFYAYGTPSFTTINSPTAYNNGAWHHVVATVGAAGMVLYVDGVVVATSSAVTSHWGGTQYWSIGRNQGSEYFNGSLDEVAFYTSQLSAAQVTAHFAAGKQLGLKKNRHCLDILNNGNSTGNGIYTIYPGGGSSSMSVYCNMNDQGGGWTLIGRGREGWAWNNAGMNTASVHTNVGTTSAFTPAYYASTTVDAILEFKPVKDLTHGVLIRRAANTTGTAWQYYKWFLTSMTSWNWIFTEEHALTKIYVNGSTRSGGNTNEYWLSGNDSTRIFTWAWGGHNNVVGFSYGLSVSGGSTASSNYFWEYGGEAHSLPYTEVYVKQTNDVGNEVLRQWYSVAQTTTYAGAVSVCASNGKKLCNRDQYCPNVSAGFETPWGGFPASGDQWAAVGDLVNDWVQVGTGGPWPSCQRHTEIAGQVHGVPSWGTDSAAYSFRNYVLCCE